MVSKPMDFALSMIFRMVSGELYSQRVTQTARVCGGLTTVSESFPDLPRWKQAKKHTMTMRNRMNEQANRYFTIRRTQEAGF